MAAGLVAMVARASRDGWPEAGGVIAQAETLRRRVLPLAQADAEAFEEALAALSLPSELEAEVRSMTIGRALERAAAVPLVIAEASADVAALAALVAEKGEPRLRGDAVTAALLAAAATRASAHLVAVNLTTTEDDERVRRAGRLADSAWEAAHTALRIES
jgi:methenyltetrahydrofolate cyclohydrolase